MAIGRTKINGDVFLPTGSVQEKSYVIFEMTGFDTDAADDAVVVTLPIRTPIAADGSIEVDLWPNPEGVRTTFYRVTFEIYNGVKAHLIDGGKIEVPVAGGPYALNDLLPIAPPQGATVSEYIAQLAAAVAASAASAASAAASAGIAGAAFNTIAELALYDSAVDDQCVNVCEGSNGELETFQYIAASTLTADGAWIVDPTGMASVGRWVSTSREFTGLTELALITGTNIPVGEFATERSTGVAYVRVADAATDFDLDYTGSVGVKWLVLINADGNVSAASLGIISDRVTDQTSEINAITTRLSTRGFIGELFIPADTKFSPSTVFAATPVGINLDIFDTCNWGQPPSYDNTMRIHYRGSLVDNDSQTIIADPHHPTIALLNMGTAGSGAASERYATILQGVGRSTYYAGDMMMGFLQQFRKASGVNKWTTQWRVQTPADIALADPIPWVTATSYTIGDYAFEDVAPYRLYRATSTGTSGASEPTGTTTHNDGGVTWEYVQEGINIDRTVFYFDEDGYAQLAGPESSKLELAGGTKRFYFEVLADGTLTMRNDSAGLDVFNVSTLHGFRFGTAQGRNWLAMSGATPTAPSTGYGKLSQGGATTVTSIPIPAGVDTMSIRIRINDGNTTLQHLAGGNLNLKGGATYAPTAYNFVEFEYDRSFDASVWYQVF